MISVAYTMRRNEEGVRISARWVIAGVEYSTHTICHPSTEDIKMNLIEMTIKIDEAILNHEFKTGKSYSVTTLMPMRLLKVLL